MLQLQVNIQLWKTSKIPFKNEYCLQKYGSYKPIEMNCFREYNNLNSYLEWKILKKHNTDHAGDIDGICNSIQLEIRSHPLSFVSELNEKYCYARNVQ